MTFTKEQLQHIIETDHVQCGDASALARMALAGMEAEPVAWRWNYGGTTSWRLQETKPNYGDNHKFPRVIQPLYTAPQPLTTSERAELENYRNAQQVVSGEKVIGTFNAEKNELALLDKDMTVERFAHWHVHNSLEVIVRDSRGAMLQGKAEPATTAYKLPVNTPCKDAPEHIWLQTAGVWPENGEFSELTWCSDNQHQDDTLYVRADVVIGNSPVITDGWVACSERLPDETNDPDGGATCYLVLYAEGRQPNGGSNVQVSNVTYLRRWHDGMITHWMPLPAAPQQGAE